jgi:membrane-bound lytic murein transglycosylase MltF
MNRPASAVAVFLLFFMASAAHADLADVRKRTQLRVLVAEGTPRFFSWKAGTAPGLEREILQGFARLQRVDLAIVPVASRAALLPALIKGEGDVAAGGLCTEDAADVDYSSEVLPSRYVVVSRRPGQSVLTPDELRAHKIGVPKGAAVAEALAAIGVSEGHVDASLDGAGLLAALNAGRVSACVLRVEQAIPAQREDPDLLLGMYIGGKASLAFALKKEDTQLRSALSEYVSNLRRSAAWNRLVLSYFGDAAADILRASR